MSAHLIVNSNAGTLSKPRTVLIHPEGMESAPVCYDVVTPNCEASIKAIVAMHYLRNSSILARATVRAESRYHHNDVMHLLGVFARPRSNAARRRREGRGMDRGYPPAVSIYLSSLTGSHFKRTYVIQAIAAPQAACYNHPITNRRVRWLDPTDNLKS